MKFKVTWYDNYFCQNITREDIQEYNSIEEWLSDNYGIPPEHMEEVMDNINNGLVVVYDEQGDKTFDPQFHSQDDWVFKIEII